MKDILINPDLYITNSLGILKLNSYNSREGELCIKESPEIQQYIEKFSILKYQGNIQIKVKVGSYIRLYYKNILLQDFFCEESYPLSSGRIYTRAIYLVKESIFKVPSYQTLSFENKEKLSEIENELKNFGKYLFLDKDKSIIWICESNHLNS